MMSEAQRGFLVNMARRVHGPGNADAYLAALRYLAPTPTKKQASRWISTLRDQAGVRAAPHSCRRGRDAHRGPGP